jgi:hypothetical protein
MDESAEETDVVGNAARGDEGVGSLLTETGNA